MSPFVDDLVGSIGERDIFGRCAGGFGTRNRTDRDRNLHRRRITHDRESRLWARKATGFAAPIERTWTPYGRYPWGNQSHRSEAESRPPPELTAQFLSTGRGDLPLSWHAQEKLLGFADPA